MSEQLDAIRRAHGHVMIEAGPGTGKTTALVDKLAYELGLLEVRPAEPLAVTDIAAITFTRASATELKDRLRSLIISRAASVDGPERSRLARAAFDLSYARIGTIDAFSRSLVQEHGSRLGLSGTVSVLDDTPSRLAIRAFLHKAMADYSADNGLVLLVGSLGYTATLNFIEEALLAPSSIRRAVYSRTTAENRYLDWPKKLSRALARSDAQLEKSGALVIDFLARAERDFSIETQRDGRLTYGQVMMRSLDLALLPEVQSVWRSTTQLLCVDEHQDTSRTQAHMLFALLGMPDAPNSTRAVFVGDPRQSIYAFRNADIRMWSKTLRNVEESGGTYVHLSKNHRSTPAIVACVNDLFCRLMPAKSATPYDVIHRPQTHVRPAHGSVSLLLSPDAGHVPAADIIARQIRHMLDAHTPVESSDGTIRPVLPSDIAILSRRLTYHADIYKEALRKYGINSTIQGGRGLYLQPEVRSLIATLLATLRPTDEGMLATYLRSPFGLVSDASLSLAVSRYGSLKNVLRGQQDLPDLSHALDMLDKWHRLVDRVPVSTIATTICSDASITSRLTAAERDNLERLVLMLASDSAMPAANMATHLVQRLDAAVDGAHADVDGSVLISTIHGAKGLEWPVVIVAAIDDTIITRDSGKSPRFCPRAGLILPSAVDLSGTVTPCPVWDDYNRDAEDAAYAEAKRTFFVAATRARDHLILATNLSDLKDGKIVTPPTLSSSAKWRHRDTVDRWLRHLYPELSRSPSSISRPGYDISVIRAADLSHVTPHDEGCHSSSSQARIPLDTPIPVVRKTITASELLQLETCAWRHHYGFSESMTTSRLVLTQASERMAALPPAIRGAIIHEFLQRDSQRGATVSEEEAMRNILLRHVPMTISQATAQVPRLIRHVNNYRSSPLAQAVASADEVLRETPFYHKIDDTLIIEGTIDLAYRSGEHWHIVDFKAAQFDDPPDMGRVLDEQADEYQIQALLYSLALSSTGRDVADFTFFFTDVGASRQMAIGPETLTYATSRISSSASRIRRRDWGEKPVYTKKLCAPCPFLLACRPPMPDLEPAQ